MTDRDETMNKIAGGIAQIRVSAPLPVLTGFLLVAMTIALYWPVQSFDFVYDDHLYVKNNRHVQNGLTLDEIRWSFTTLYAGNWHPLTWLSHMADFDLYGFHAGGHHWTNVMIHAANALLLFLVLSCMTQSLWASSLVAALFAVHPLHVESVAWVSERKDLLCGFFWILTMGAYVHYVKNPTLRRYHLVLGSFTLGLLSKAMIVTLPLVLLLLDYWPLRRFTGTKTVIDRWVLPGRTTHRIDALRLMVEKIPLLLLVAISCVVTIVAQERLDALWSLEKMPLDVRIANAIVSYAEYIEKAVWPAGLAILYPHAGMPPIWKIWAALLLLSSISFIVIRKARDLPFLIVGWLWYLGTLVPVIGIVQVGPQSMADRYTYMPLIGIFIAAVWGAKSLVAARSPVRNGFIVFSATVLSAFLIVSNSQIAVWKNSITLFEHTLTVEEVNPIARYNIGAYYLEKGDCKQAVPHFLAAIDMNRDFAFAYYGLGVCSVSDRHADKAFQLFSQAIMIDPQLTRPRLDRGSLLMQQGKEAAAMEDFREVLRMDPANETAHNTLGMILLQQGRVMDAEVHLSEALRVNPRNVDARNNMGIVRSLQGRLEEAISCFEKAAALAPENTAIERNLTVTRSRQKTD